MTYSCITVAGLIFANFSLILILWNNFSNSIKNPTYLKSSYDKNIKIESKSLLLESLNKSLKNLISKNSEISKEVNERNKNYLVAKLKKIEFIKKLISKDNLNITLENGLKIIIKRIEKSYKFEIKHLINNSKKEEEKNKIRITENTKISLFLDESKRNVYVFKVTNDGKILNKYLYKKDVKNLSMNNSGEIALYTIPLKKLINSKEKFQFENIKDKIKYSLAQIFKFNYFSNKKTSKLNSYIQNCFISNLFGKIIGVVASSNKKSIAVAYEIKTATESLYRIRYIHNIQNFCNKGKKEYQNLQNFQNKIIQEFSDYIDIKGKNINNHNHNFNKLYYEISNKKNYEEKTSKNMNMPNFFSDEFFDDFSFGINFPIKAMAIKNNILAFAMDNQKFQYTVLKREKNYDLNESLWKVLTQGPVLDQDLFKFFHTNSLKFLEEEYFENSKNIYNMIQIITTIKTDIKYQSKNKYAKIETSGIIRRIKGIKFNKYFENENNEIKILNKRLEEKINKNYLVKFFKVDLLKVVYENKKSNFSYCELEGNNKFQINKCLENIKKYLRPSLFSNNNVFSEGANLYQSNKDSLLMEFNEGNLILIESNLQTNNLNLMILNPEKKSKIEKIYSDSENKNLIIVNLNNFF